MKKLFIMLAAAATVVSCANEETISRVEGEAIEFGNVFVDNATRATAATDPSLGTTTNPFNTFNVWGTVGGVAIYSGDVITKGENNIWTSTADKKQYWIEGAQYKFAAVAGVASTAVTPGADMLPAKVAIDATGANVDLLYAAPVSYEGRASGGNTEVAFTFNHLLSKVKFTVNNTSTEADRYSFNVRDIVVKGSKTGTINLSDKLWEDKSEAAAYDALPTITVNKTIASAECANELLLIPGSIDITFVVDILCDGTKIATHEYTTPYTKSIVGGCAYNFTIGVSVGDEIKFTVDTYNDWNYQTPSSLN